MRSTIRGLLALTFGWVEPSCFVLGCTGLVDSHRSFRDEGPRDGGRSDTATDGGGSATTPGAAPSDPFAPRPAAYEQASNADASDWLGYSVQVSHEVVVGALGERSAAPGDPNDNSVPAAGAVYVFRATGN